MKPWGFYRKLQSGAIVLRQVCSDFVFFVESQVFGMGLQKVSCERAVPWITEPVGAGVWAEEVQCFQLLGCLVSEGCWQV